MNFLALRGIPYYPELGTLTGGISSAILMTQLEYWFEKMNNKPFYKFLEPCDHASYEIGDSWIEELGMSKDEFRSAFSKIGMVYKSKKEFDKAEDKFQGKFYCSYIDRIERRTYYFRNSTLIEEVLKTIFDKKNEDKQNDKNSDFYKSGKSISRSRESQSLEIGKVDFYKSENPISNNSILLQEITTGDYQENTTITTTNQKSINHVEPTQTEVESSSSISKNLNDIKKYLLENVKDIQTCKNIIFIVENQGVTLDRIKLVVEHTNKNKKGLGFIVEALKNNWSIQEAKKEQAEKGRGQKINSEAISTAIESKKEFEQYATEHEILNKLYDNLDSSLKEKVDQLAYKKAIALNPIPSVARTLVKTTTKIQVLKLLRQEGEI